MDGPFIIFSLSKVMSSQTSFGGFTAEGLSPSLYPPHAPLYYARLKTELIEAASIIFSLSKVIFSQGSTGGFTAEGLSVPLYPSH